MLFQFEHMDLDRVPGGLTGKWERKPLDLADLKATTGRWQKDLAGKGWNSLYLSNHDQPRPVSRFGDDGTYRVQSAKLLATFLHLLQGTPYVYQGEEIGHDQCPVRLDRRLPRHRDAQHVPRVRRPTVASTRSRSWR